MDTVCHCDRARLSRGCHLRESAPCLAHQAIAPAKASLSLLLRGLCSLTRASSHVPLVSQLFMFSVIMLTLTPASSTPAPCPRSLFATLVTSRRRVHERRRREALASQGLPVRRLHQGTPAIVREHLLSKKKPLFVAFTTSASGTSKFVITLSRFTVSSDSSPCDNAIADT